MAGGYVAWGGPGAGFAAWLSTWLWTVMVVPLLTVLPLIFPDGAVPSPRWRPVAWTGWSATAVLAVGVATGSSPVTSAGAVIAALAAIGGVAALAARWRDGDGRHRQQVKFLLAAVVFVLVVEVTAPVLPGPVAQAGLFLIPVALVGAIVAAVLRYRLYDIDVVIRRTVVHLALAGAILAGYAVIVLGLTRLLPDLSSPIAQAAAVLIVAMALDPARRWLRRRLDRLMFGQRDDPMAALTALRRRLAESGGPDLRTAIEETVRAAVRAPHAAVLLADQPPGPARDAVELPLTHDGELVGRLVVGRRGPAEEYGPADLALLEELAARAGTAVWAVRQHEDLAELRRSAVLASAEERARLGRDLHDGLGPLLAGAALSVDGIRLGLADDAAAGRLAQVAGRIRSAATEVRRVVAALRPGPLADLGLAGALRDHADQLAAILPVEVRARVGRPLPAAVEQAAYLVAMEAVTNVVRHAAARTCRIDIEVAGGRLVLTVTDDGTGLADGYVRGVGLASMRSRAAELGGSLALTSTSDGTVVRAFLPLPEDVR